ncbi:hypothetical protein GUY60_03965 [Streptomyces sp. YC537]|uniref:Uncharacterized protein n=2 Tax=Streptomyces boluensis TaxID=1775135 RepID=A0A964UMQ0_9ACTN|nr:hypothetical protein [Streptomyces boluensis]
MPDLSCYTTNLLAHLTPDVPDVRRRFAESVRLAVRVDPDAGELGAGELAFSHHPRVDITPDGRELAYRGAPDWPSARVALLDQLHADGRVLAVGSVRHLPWAPGYGRADAPHWVLLREYRDGRWFVADHFTALTPHGEQEPYLGWLTDGELAAALTPAQDPPPEVARRDRFALGGQVPVPPAGHHRWLAWQPRTTPVPPADPGPGRWSLDTAESLTRVAAVLRDHPEALSRHVDDLWAAARHHTYRLAFAVADGALHPERAAAATAAWGELPRTLRFAAQSAARGRPRPTVVDRSIEQLLTAQADLGTDFPQEG